MGFIHGANRHAEILLPERLDDYIAEENPVRFLDAFVDHLNLTTLGFQRAQPAGTGRPAYDPADLLKLYMYGYLYRLRSSRRLEQETQGNSSLLTVASSKQSTPKSATSLRTGSRNSSSRLTNASRAISRTLTARITKMRRGHLVGLSRKIYRRRLRRSSNASSSTPICKPS
jgi:transposase